MSLLRLGLVLALSVVLHADTASRLYKQGQKAEAKGKDLEAFFLYARASGLKPLDGKYRTHAERARIRAAQGLAALGRVEEASTLDPAAKPTVAAELVPTEDLAEEEDSLEEETPEPLSAAEVREAEIAMGPAHLKPQAAWRSFDTRGTVRTLYEQVAKAFQLSVVFDTDLSDSRTLQLRLENADFVDTIHALTTMTSTFLVPLNERVFLVAQDTQPKRTELEPMMAVLLPIPQVLSPEEANEVGRAVQQALDIKRLVVDSGRRQVYVRDTVTRVSLARALYADLSRRRGEVMIEVQLISASRNSLTNIGLTLPTSFLVTPLGTLNGPPPDPGSGAAATFGGGDTRFGLRIADSAAQADWTRSQAELLSSFQIRATDALPANLHIGDKYPIVNTIYSPAVIDQQIQDLQQSGEYRAPFPSVSFEDLGLVVKITPRIHDGKEVSLTLEAEYRLLTGATLNGLPVISSRKFNSSVRLREGQTSLVAGFTTAQQGRNDSGFAGLGRIPLIGRLFRRETWQRDESELVLAITPRVTILPPGEQARARVYYSGTESRLVPAI